MNYPAEIKKLIYTSIVPIVCGNNRGTAFFVGKDMLLTARHVVVDHFDHQDPIVAKADVDILCNAKELGEPGEPIDVVLLKCNDYENNDYLPLLSAEYNEERDLTIIGYPRELGNCTDLITITVRDRIKSNQDGYDITVIRTDSLAFTSYKGFSGSPVINEKGSVIGVTVMQLNSNLGYVSIKKIEKLLENNSVAVNDDWQSEDMSPLGRGRCQQQVQNAISYASLRYNDQLHIPNTDLDQAIDVFARKEARDKMVKRIIDTEKHAMSFDAIKGKIPQTQIETLDFAHLYYVISGIYNDLPKEDKPIALDKFFEDEYDSLQGLVDFLSEYENIKILYIGAEAGMGKTHYMCATASRLVRYMNVYLLFGSKFTSGDFDSQLVDMMGINGKSLRELNDEMVQQNQNALIIIDAINEGATDVFWKQALNNLTNEIDSLSNIRLIVTCRSGDNLIGITENLTITGFDGNTKEAVDRYFDYYHIKDDDHNLYKRFSAEFSQPLFLRLFCEVAQSNRRPIRQDMSLTSLYLFYVQQRNIKISEGVDEDIHRNVTEKLLLKIANYSLFYNACNDTPRKKARIYADQICRYRTWRHSLLYCCLKENLLLETGANGESVMFGFQRLGDILEVYTFLNRKLSDEAKVDFVIDKANSNSSRYRDFLVTLLSEWDLTPQLLSRNILHNNYLLGILFDSIKYHSPNNQALFDWMEKNKVFNLNILRKYIQELPENFFDMAHHSLKILGMPQRDKWWTVQVNGLYETYLPQRLENFISIDGEDNKKKLLLYSWMCTSTHPYVRGRLLRKLVQLFDKNHQLALDAIEYFCDCNDTYVTQVITCAVYGHILRSRDVEESKIIAEAILEKFYPGDTAPDDLLVRQWTMLSIQYADYIANTHAYWPRLKMPFASQDPYNFIGTLLSDGDEHYFGKTEGSWRLYKTLCDFSDFNRYILGSNSNFSSINFCKNVNGKYEKIPLQDIRNMMSGIIMHEYNWDDELAELDKGLYSDSRYDNKKERFAKKYLWMALYKVDALLCDHASILKDRFNGDDESIKENNIVDEPYPWLVSDSSRIDPTTISENEEVKIKFTPDKLGLPESVSNDDWISEKYPLPQARLLVKDEKGADWILLTCYDGYKADAKDNTYKDLWLYTNAAFIKTEELEVYEAWAKEQNFYGRWMPECRNGSIEYLWNEYPWSDKYKRFIPDIDKNATHTEMGFQLYLSYEAQLQEKWPGLNEERSELREVSMPNHRVMEKLGLYTTERGIVRAIENKEIVSAPISDGRLQGLAIRKDYLDRYLKEEGYSLAFYTLGEKMVRNKGNYMNIGNRYDLSGAYAYQNGKIITVSPLHITQKFPK